MAANYYCLLFDLDGTLLDFSADERAALKDTLATAEIDNSEESIDTFAQINEQVWAELEKNQIKRERLGAERFNRFLQKVEAKTKIDANKLNQMYMENLSKHATVFPGAQELLEELGEFATLAVVSNANKRVQMSRLEISGLLPYFDDVFLSETVGTTKPSAKFFDIALKQLGIKNKEKVLVIGDSLTADIQGGINAKLDTCWCNFTQQENNKDIVPTYTVDNYIQLKIIAIGEEELKNAEHREKKHIV